MDLKPNEHKRIYFNITTMASLGLIGPPKILGPPQKNFIFLLRSPPPNYFGLKSLGPPLNLLPWQNGQVTCVKQIRLTVF